MLFINKYHKLLAKLKELQINMQQFYNRKENHKKN